jgi:hypothetical protein
MSVGWCVDFYSVDTMVGRRLFVFFLFLAANGAPHPKHDPSQFQQNDPR